MLLPAWPTLSLLLAAPPAEDQWLSIIVSGTPSVVECKSSWLGTRTDGSSIVFSIRAAADPISNVIVSATGLGKATFEIDVPTAKGPASRPAGSLYLTLDTLDRAGQSVTLRIPPEAFPAPGKGFDGAIQISALAQPALVLPLRLESPSPNDFFSAMRWFFGIVLPVTLTGFVGYGGYVLKKNRDLRIAAKGKFNEHVNNNWAELHSVFTEFYPNLNQVYPASEPEWTKDLQEKLQAAINKIPAPQRDKLLGAFATRERETIKRHLASNFPHWKSAILMPQNPHA